MNPNQILRTLTDRALNVLSSVGIGAPFRQIEHFVVLMLENRSFDHLFGYLKQVDQRIDGISGNEFNYIDPTSPSQKIPVRPATSGRMNYDPGHEFADVSEQIFGSRTAQASSQARMNGFVACAQKAAANLDDGNRIMECFKPTQLPVLSALAREFALFNYWYSSMPGPTFPNRFFVHCATSGGLTDAPSWSRIPFGFSFENDTVFAALSARGKSWHVYHADALAQTQVLAIRSMLKQIRSPQFRKFAQFKADAKAGALAHYNFIEPKYDAMRDFSRGNSMHPLNDVAAGEALVKDVYETLRNSPLWPKSALLITFDEHGGFFDHVAPPKSVPTGDDLSYSDRNKPFAFDRYGVRVPAVFVSAYTARGTVIGRDASGTPLVFDHSAVPATLASRFGLPTLTRRDAAMMSAGRTLAQAINLKTPRLSASAAPESLPMPAELPAAPEIRAFSPDAPLTPAQESFLGLARACEAKIAPERIETFRADTVKTKGELEAYIREVETKVQLAREAERGPR